MADNAPGLQPRKLDGEVDIQVESDRLPAEPTVSEKPSVDTKVEQTHVSDNTEATTKQTEGNVEEAQVEQPVSQREANRIQELANARNAAEARAAQAEAMLQRLVNVQPQQPVQSEAEMLAKAYKTYDPIQGYPTDPKEYSHFVASNAAMAARQEAQRINAQQREQQETAEFVRAYPNEINDPIFVGAVAAQRAQAQRQGGYLSYKEAADLVQKSFEQRVNKKVIADVANNDKSKDEAYVESARGASASSRTAGSTPDIEKMTLAEKEAWLKANGAW